MFGDDAENEFIVLISKPTVVDVDIGEVIESGVIMYSLNAYRVRLDAVDATRGTDKAGCEKRHHSDVGSNIENSIAFVNQELV